MAGAKQPSFLIIYSPIVAQYGQLCGYYQTKQSHVKATIALIQMYFFALQ